MACVFLDGTNVSFLFIFFFFFLLLNPRGGTLLHFEVGWGRLLLVFTLMLKLERMLDFYTLFSSLYGGDMNVLDLSK